jgi:hypothetical protein
MKKGEKRIKKKKTNKQIKQHNNITQNNKKEKRKEKKTKDKPVERDTFCTQPAGRSVLMLSFCFSPQKKTEK